MAPEAEGYFSAADIWSVGITLIELATGEAPNASATMDRILMSTLDDGAMESHLALVGGCSEALRDIVKQCLCRDPAQRPSADKLLDHRFFRVSCVVGRMFVFQALLGNELQTP